MHGHVWHLQDDFLSGQANVHKVVVAYDEGAEDVEAYVAPPKEYKFLMIGILPAGCASLTRDRMHSMHTPYAG